MRQDWEGPGSCVTVEEVNQGKGPAHNALDPNNVHIVILLISRLACPPLLCIPGTTTPASGGLGLHTTSTHSVFLAPFHVELTAQLKAL